MFLFRASLHIRITVKHLTWVDLVCFPLLLVSYLYSDGCSWSEVGVYTSSSREPKGQTSDSSKQSILGIFFLLLALYDVSESLRSPTHLLFKQGIHQYEFFMCNDDAWLWSSLGICIHIVTFSHILTTHSCHVLFCTLQALYLHHIHGTFWMSN